jgi:hypothetical protein
MWWRSNLTNTVIIMSDISLRGYIKDRERSFVKVIEVKLLW